jgi:hypothetical protein
MVGAGTEVGRVYQALRFLGRDRVDDAVVDTLRRRVPADVRRQLNTDLMKNPHAAPDWILAVSKRLADDL